MRTERFKLQRLDWPELPYNDATTLPRADRYRLDTEQGVPGVEIEGVFHYHPVVGFGYVLRMLSMAMKDENDKHLVATANKYVEVYVTKAYLDSLSKSIWFPYTFDFPLHHIEEETMQAPWFSGMAQGMALSCFVRLYYLKKNPNYMEWALWTLRTFTQTKDISKDRWISRIDDSGYYWIEEYPREEPTQVLNGFIYAVFGLYDYWLLLRNNKGQVCNLICAALSTIKHYAELWRNPGKPSYYCLKHKVLCDKMDYKYHRVHIRQFEQLYKISRVGFFKEFAEKLREDLEIYQKNILKVAAA